MTANHQLGTSAPSMVVPSVTFRVTIEKTLVRFDSCDGIWNRAQSERNLTFSLIQTRLSDGSPTAYIKSATVQDSGNYTCSNYQKTQIAKLELIVVESRSSLASPINGVGIFDMIKNSYVESGIVRVKKDMRLSVRCFVGQDYSSGTVQWTPIGGMSYERLGNATRIHEYPNSFSVNSALLDDQGTYICHSSSGNAVTGFRLIVER